jgi:hypothetical protein
MTGTTALIALLDEHHITDRSLLRARDRARDAGDDASADALRREIERYFAGVERESQALLTALDRKLDDLYQRQYNLQAERGVAQRRLEGARKALGAVDASKTGDAR